MSLVAHDGRISWGTVATFESLFPLLEIDEIAKHLSVVRASLMTEADAQRAESLAMVGEEEGERQREAHDAVVAQIKNHSRIRLAPPDHTSRESAWDRAKIAARLTYSARMRLGTVGEEGGMNPDRDRGESVPVTST